MSKSTSPLTPIRRRLQNKEQEYKNRISEESNELEAQTKKALQSSAVVLGGLVVGFTVYKLLAGKDSTSQSNGKKKVSAKSSSGKRSFLQSIVADRLIAFLIQLGFTYLSKKVKQNGGDTKSTSRKQK
ncbi:MAG: hypothetical protein AAGC88_15350 [Bacteroidota bacterium]